MLPDVQGASRCFVTCRYERVVGYYALASASIQHGGVADFAIADPEGNRWSFCTYRGEPRKA